MLIALLIWSIDIWIRPSRSLRLSPHSVTNFVRDYVESLNRIM